MIQVVPAIDLKSGKCVRLSQGKADQETIYQDDPAEVAEWFQSEGARRLHLVDLDGAFQGVRTNNQAIRRVRQAFKGQIELGGGIRSAKDVAEVLEMGIDYAIVGTMAVKNPEALQAAIQQSGPERIILGIDAKDGMVSVSGWVEDTQLEAVAFARRWGNEGIGRVIFTDIARDGMMSGPNLPAIQAFAQGYGRKVTASGGVSSAKDLTELNKLYAIGVDQVIIGKAIYEGTINLEEVL